MKCEQFEVLLNQVLDDRLDPSSNAALVQHAHVCRPCEAMLEALSRIDDMHSGQFFADQQIFGTSEGSRLKSQPGLPADFAARVVNQYLSELDNSSAKAVQSHDCRESVLADLIDSRPPVDAVVVSSRANPSLSNQTDTAKSQPKRASQPNSGSVKGVWSSRIGNITVAVALVGFIALPVIAFLIAGSNGTGTGNGSAIQPLALNNQPEIHNPESGELGLGQPQVRSSSGFMGPTPFCTGGNFAVVVSQMPNPVERLGIDTLNSEIVTMTPITRSLETLFRAFFNSMRPLSGGRAQRPANPNQSGMTSPQLLCAA